MEQLVVGNFTAHLDEATSAITVMNGGEKISFQTGEAQGAKNAIKFAASLLNTPVLPNHIKFSPFTVVFKEDGEAYLSREASKLTFSKATWEDLIKIIDMSVHRVADYLKIRGGPRAGVSSVRMPDPLI